MEIFERYPLLKRIAGTQSTILLTGPTGTGKSFLAEYIHRNSTRKTKPFVSINLATLNENLLESELFGHERGAFSGANLRRLGKLEGANGGTVLLDEIGELSLNMQTRLLEALNSKTISPVGSNRDIHLDVRIVTATNRNLSTMVRAGTFRSDLYFRINMFHVELASLADTPELIEFHAYDFLEKLNQNNSNSVLTTFKRFSPGFVEAIKKYRWPGNLRELKNAIEYAAMVNESGTIEVTDLPSYIMNESSSEPLPASTFPINYYEAKNIFEKQYLTQMLENFGGKINLTARKTQLSKVTLIEKIRKYNIDINNLKISVYQNTKQKDLLKFL